ncbi:glycoside hydrolase superfamily [Mycena rosella]|uniref:glucan endo-1,3-beta-D-glucosidase n=1 Tax=Mycena rosella TaxID=1033263 RepID=A0AAD7GXD3_MYCRO|nr:glycoside hydrolase superfamily [Mycena rosella]
MQHPYRDSPQHSEADLHQYYDTPYGHGAPPGLTQDIPLVPQKYNGYGQPFAADSQANITGRDYPSGTILGAVGLLGLIGAGVALGIVLAKRSSASTSVGSSSSTSSSPSKSSSSDGPSSFTKDPALVQSFYGIAYTPEGSQLPDCGNSLDTVITDVQLLSQITTRIRLYGADCNQSELVLEAIAQTKVDMSVWLGNYIVATDNGTAYTRQRDVIKTAIQKYGVEHIGGVTVGNEFMLNYLTAAGATDLNGTVANTGAAILIDNIKDTRSMMSELGLSNISVGTSDAGAYFNTLVLESVDYGMANVHPWFADTTIQDAAAWTTRFFAETDVTAAAAVSNSPQMYIAETGWPSNSSDAASATNGAAAASEANLQIFMDTFVCQANANGTKYFFFSYQDEKWKDEQFGGVEGWWGLFHQNRTLKGVTIPTCT